MSITPKLKLVKPLPSDFYDIEVQNGNMDKLEAVIAEGVTNTTQLSLTTPIVITRTSTEAQSAEINLTPISYPNILGKDGNCEVLSKFTTVGTPTLDSAKRVFGSSAIKLVSPVNTLSTMGLTLPTAIDTSKVYLASAYVEASHPAGLCFGPAQANSTGGGIVSISAGAMNRVGFKLSTALTSGYLSVFCPAVSGIATILYVDGLMLTPVDANDYATLTVAQLMAKYPYVDSLGVTANPSVKITHADGSVDEAYIEGDFLTGDVVNIVDNQVIGSKMWSGKKVLYGKDMTTAAFSSDFVGNKRLFITTPLVPLLGATNSILIKPDGKLMKSVSSWALADEYELTLNGMWFTAPDTDTGFTETLNPNDDEVKAFMNGWKATANNGTRYTAWVSVVDGTTVPTTQSIDFVKANLAPLYEGYQLYYKYATPKTINEDSDSYLAPLKGDALNLEVGANSVVFDTGVVRGEVANPFNAGDGSFRINSLAYATDIVSILKNKAEYIHKVYKNGVDDDANWTHASNVAYGNDRRSIPAANFDPSAIYTVDYTILRTIAPQISTAQLKYNDGIVSAINKLYNVVETKQNQSLYLDEFVNRKIDAKKIVLNDIAVTTITSGFASGWSGSIVVRKGLGSLCKVDINLTKSSDVVGFTTVYKLPVGLRPLNNVFVNGMILDINSIPIVGVENYTFISLDGDINIYTIGATPGTRIVIANYTYYSA